MEITSLQNSKVKYWVSLKNKKVRDEHGEFIIEGDHLLKEAQAHGILKETISIDDPACDYLVTKEIMQKISSQKSISSTIGICAFLKEEKPTEQILILDNLQDPGNLGTIIRSAVAFHFTTIILSMDSVDLYNEKVIRASEGMIFQVNILRRDLKTTIPALKNDGYLIVGTSVTKGEDIKSIKNKKLAIVIGNEGQGISLPVKSLCDKMTYLPMEKSCESLNAGIAASILMYEVYHE